MKPDDEAGKPTRKIWDRFIGLNNRIRQSEMKPVTSLAAVAFYFGGMIILLIAPLSFFIHIMKNGAYSTIENEVMTLTPCGNQALLLLVAITFALSVLTGGFGRSLLRKRFVYGWVVALGGLGLLWGLTVTLDEFRKITAKIAAIEQGDNLTVAAFLTFWTLMIGYAGKAVWDELRDRVSANVDGYLPKKAAEEKSPAAQGPKIEGGQDTSKQETRLNNPPQQMVRIDKATDTFFLYMPGEIETGGIPAEFLPELIDQLNLSGSLLSCGSYMVSQDGAERSEDS